MLPGDQKILLFSKKSAYVAPWVPEGFFYRDKGEKIFSGSSQPLNFRRKQQEKRPFGTQGTYLASWISQVQNTDYYELPSITFLEHSLDKSRDLGNMMNIWV